MMTLRATYLLLIATLLVAVSSPLRAQDAGPDDAILTLRADGPAEDSAYFPRSLPSITASDPAWIVRSGHKKGIMDSELDAEASAAPDFAILKNGFFEPWPRLLADFHEPAVLAEPGNIAGLERTKPVLIIPSGGLRGFSSSAFFKAGLEEYVRSGGMVVCFSQQTGTDYSGLPVPAGARLLAAGWSEDAGPLFRASSIRSAHAALSGAYKSVPEVETSGYLNAYPAESDLLLSRSDGKPTMISYPFGAGRVLVTTLFPDYSSAYEQLNPEAVSIIRSLLQWAKHPRAVIAAAPGDRLNLALEASGPEQGTATSLRISVVGPAGETIGMEQRLMTSVASGTTVTVQVTFTVPLNPAPGVYHLEYRLADAAGNPLSGPLESWSGRFSVSRHSDSAHPHPALPDAPLALRMNARWERPGRTGRLLVEIDSAQKLPADAERSFFIRAAGNEKSFVLGADKVSLSFDLLEQAAPDGRILVAAYRRNGRSVARLTVDLPSPAAGITFDRAVYQPGDRMTVRTRGLGKGQLSLIGLGTIQDQMVSLETPLSITLSDSAPAGAYRLHWLFETPSGKPQSGSELVNVNGYRVRVREVMVSRDDSKDMLLLRFLLQSTQTVTAAIHAKLRSPDGAETVLAERPVALTTGERTIPLDTAFKTGASGIWQLLYDITTRMPESPGLPREPVVLASGRVLFDVGNAALLGLVASKPVYYEPEGPVDLSAYVFGRGASRLEVFLDNDKVIGDQRLLDGLSAIPVTLDRPRHGPHLVKAVLANDDLKSSVQQSVIFGTRFPDLAIDLFAGEVSSLTTSLNITVRNQGKSTAGKSIAALYEGDPAANGKPVNRTEIPQLAPHEQYHAVVAWNAARKTGAVKFTAIADADAALIETNRKNNTATADLTIPALALRIEPHAKQALADEGLVFVVKAVNFSSERYRGLTIRIDIAGPHGNLVSSETIPVPEFGEASELKFDRRFGSRGMGIGQYRMQALLYRIPQTPLATASDVVSVEPTLKVAGSLERTPAAAYQCMPFAIEYGTTVIGNVAVSSGGLNLDIRPSGSEMSVYTRRFAFSEQLSTVLPIERITFPQGDYIISLKTSVTNSQYGLKQETLLAEQPLAVRSPVSLRQRGVPLPRVLVWFGKDSGALDRAITETMVQQAFADNEVYYRIADTAEDFAKQVRSGLFNLFALVAPDDFLEDTASLKNAVNRGAGLVIIGSEDRPRSIAETFGFRFSEPRSAEKGSRLVFTGDGDIGLSGSVPLSGNYLLPLKQGAKPAILLDSSQEPVALLDRTGDGSVLVMPFSLIRSARDAGTIPPFSLLLRSAVRGVAPASADRDAVSGEELSIAAPNGPVRSIVTISLPPGSEALWTSGNTTLGINTIRFETTAGKEPQKLQYLYRRPAGSKARASVDLSYECGGSMTPPRKIE